MSMIDKLLNMAIVFFFFFFFFFFCRLLVWRAG